MLDKLASIEKHYEELHNLMADPAVSSNPTRLREITREISGLEEIVAEIPRIQNDARRARKDARDPPRRIG